MSPAVRSDCGAFAIHLVVGDILKRLVVGPHGFDFVKDLYDAPATGAAAGRVGVVDANLVGIVDAVEHDVVAYVGKRTGAHCGDNGPSEVLG